MAFVIFPFKKNELFSSAMQSLPSIEDPCVIVWWCIRMKGWGKGARIHSAYLKVRLFLCFWAFRFSNFGSCLSYNEQWQPKRQKTCVSACIRLPKTYGRCWLCSPWSQIKAAGKLDFIRICNRWRPPHHVDKWNQINYFMPQMYPQTKWAIRPKDRRLPAAMLTNTVGLR